VLIAIIGRITDAQRTGRLFTPAFGPGAVVMSHSVFGVPQIPSAARQTLAALRAADGWPDAPRPVHANELLPERALLGESQARASLVTLIHDALAEEPALLQTAEVFLERATGIEATARVLFVHPNTVRYRLKRIAEVTGYSPTDPRGAFVLRTGLTVRRLGRIPPIDGAL
jgi:DNA-binding PucR family transcriptional regulator